MKLPLLTVLLVTLISCNNAAKKERLSMPGAYKMLYQKIKGGKTDTSFTSLLQQKLFSGDYMMYANFNPPDSVSSFGIGQYSVNADTVTEKVFYSASDTSKSDTRHNYKLYIEKNAAGYQQVIPQIESRGDNYVLTEQYENIGSADSTSLLDGVWKLEKVFYVKGKDTVISHTTQFKMYEAGHFVWGHTYADSTGKTHTGMGFGTFTMNGTDKVKESVKVSSYAGARQDFDIALIMNGSDGFQQTITDKDSSKQVEIYTRLK